MAIAKNWERRVNIARIPSNISPARRLSVMIQRKQNKDGHFWHTMSRSNVIMVSESYVCCDVELQTDEEQEQTQSNTNKSSPSTTLAATEFFLKQVDCVMPCDPNFLYGFWANNKY